MILTPCLPHKSCTICENRLFPQTASPAKKAAKFAHQASSLGDRIAFVLITENLSEPHTLHQLEHMTRRAAGFARMALDLDTAAVTARKSA